MTRSWHRSILGVGTLLVLTWVLISGVNTRGAGFTPQARTPGEGYVEALADAPPDLTAQPELPRADALEPTPSTPSACGAACEEIFLPEATGFAAAPRASHRSLRALAGSHIWWVGSAPGREHSALLCVENEPPELECPWVMPLEATVTWGAREERVQAALAVAEGLLEITLHPSGTDERCTCLPFDLRARVR